MVSKFLNLVYNYIFIFIIEAQAFKQKEKGSVKGPKNSESLEEYERNDKAIDNFNDEMENALHMDRQLNE